MQQTNKPGVLADDGPQKRICSVAGLSAIPHTYKLRSPAKNKLRRAVKGMKSIDPPSMHLGKENSPWRETRESEWSDLKWQLQHLIRTPEQLAELPGLSETETASHK